MIRLLVSAKDAPDAVEALAGGAEILDLKDPAAGPLGAPSPEIVRRAAPLARAAGVPLSVALGEAGGDRGVWALAAGAAAGAGARYVKIALEGGRGAGEAARLVRAVVESAGEGGGPEIVVVGYADRLGAPGGIAELVGAAAEGGASGVLLDTAEKDGRTLFDHLREDVLRGFIENARACGLFAGLAGSLRGGSLVRAAKLGPDIIGVRGAVAAGGRNGVVDRSRVAALSKLLEPFRVGSGARGMYDARVQGAGRNRPAGAREETQ